MRRPWTHLLAFLVGIALTVGLYESRRLLRNTARVYTVAQGQISGEPTAPPGQSARRQTLIEKVEENPEAARRLAAALEARADGQTELSRTAERADEGKRLKGLKRAALQGLSNEELKAIWERRQARKERNHTSGRRGVSSERPQAGLDPFSPDHAEPGAVDTAMPMPADQP